MNDIVKTLLPYFVCFILGVLVCLMFRGCGDPLRTQTEVIEKPIYTTQYIDRWRTDTVRFVSKQVVTKYDTVTLERVVNRLDTLLLIDTVKIVEAWLTELNSYDTTVTFENAYFTLRWQNYQNLTENLVIDYTPKNRASRYAIGLHANVGMLSDFKTNNTPLFGLGLQATVKKSYFGVDYGFNGRHYLGARVGYNIISK